MIIKERGEGERRAALSSPPPLRLSLSRRWRVTVALSKNHVTLEQRPVIERLGAANRECQRSTERSRRSPKN